METNRTKFLTKDYLTEQFYNYNKKYIIDDVKKNKQDNLEITSRHITWEDTHKLGLNISNDREAQPYDYLILEPWDDDDYYEDEFGDKIYGQGKLRWDSPIDDQSKIEDGSKFLVNGNAIYNWKGSENITTLGQITEGIWKVGRLELFSEVDDDRDETYEKIGNFKIEFINSDANNLKITGQSDGTYEPTIVIEPKTELNETDIKGKTMISSSLTVNGQTEITGKLIGSIAEFSGGITVGEDGDNNVAEDEIQQKTDTFSNIRGSLTVSKLTVSKELTVAAPAEFLKDVEMDESLSVGKNFTVSEEGEVKTSKLEASSEITTRTLNVNTIKIIDNESGYEEDGDEELDEEEILDYDYSTRSVNFENNTSFKGERLFINSETDIIVVKSNESDGKGDGTEYYQPIKINGKYMKLADDNDVAVESWIAELQS